MFDAASTLTSLGGPLSLLVIVGIVFAESGILVGSSCPATHSCSRPGSCWPAARFTSLSGWSP